MRSHNEDMMKPRAVSPVTSKSSRLRDVYGADNALQSPSEWSLRRVAASDRSETERNGKRGWEWLNAEEGDD